MSKPMEEATGFGFTPWAIFNDGGITECHFSTSVDMWLIVEFIQHADVHVVCQQLRLLANQLEHKN